MGCTNHEPVLGSLDVIPLPKEMIKREGQFVFQPSTTIAVENEEQKRIAGIFTGQFEK